MPFTQGRQFPLHSWIDFFGCKLHVQPCLRVLLILAIPSLENLVFNRRTVSANLPPSWKEQGETVHDPDTV